MDCNEEEIAKPGPSTTPVECTGSGSAVNSLILDYYKKFGRKRDLEQYFSLSTAQSDVKDPSSTFWRKMKNEESSDSSGKKSDSSQELCRISIRCSVPDGGSSQYNPKPKAILTGPALLESLGIHVKALEDESKAKSESTSPPIITEDAQSNTQQSDDESNRSYDNNSQKSLDVMDTSANKPQSPTSSITSQRKLEWDSLADVGYANESDRKNSASSLSTLERLALKQQYSNNDTKLDSILEPTAHSTPLDDEPKYKVKKGVGKKSTKIYKKDVDYLELNMPQSESHPPQSINVNLTKHISFNVEKDGRVTVDNVTKDVSVSPEKITETPKYQFDKDVQTSLIKIKDTASQNSLPHKVPVLISLNTLRRYTRRKKFRMARKKLKLKKKVGKENIPVQEKSGEQLSEAESFEYMPGHMYNQNQLNNNRSRNIDRSGNTAGNKSSLESSGLPTTDSSKGSTHSFSKDLQKSIDILRAALQNKGDDTLLRKKLIKQVCERLMKSKYRDDETSTDFLSGLSFSSKKLGLGNRNQTTSTSDNSGEKIQRPKKSILRNEKFNAGDIASTSQSVPNLPTVSKSEKLVTSNLMKNLTTSNTDSDLSKDKSSSDNNFSKTSSQILYQKYLEALKREEAYKQHLKDKEMFLKQKLVCSSDTALKIPSRPDVKVNRRLKDLIKDLTRNNYDDGSGDASKLEGGPNSSRDINQFVPIRSQRSHSVFTLSSSGNNDRNKKPNMKKRLQCDLKDLTQPGTSREHYCCCPYHNKPKQDTDGQLSIKQYCNSSACENKKTLSPRRESSRCQTCDGSEVRKVCFCKNTHEVPDNFTVVRCSKYTKNDESGSTSNASCNSKSISPRKNKNSASVHETIIPCPNREVNKPIEKLSDRTTTKSSQTNFLLKMLRRSSGSTTSSCGTKHSVKAETCSNVRPDKVYEATRWLQTEISINPKIPEPSLSDINIVTDCANLVSEQCRCLKKPSTTDACSRPTEGSSCNSGSTKSSGTSKDVEDFFIDNLSARKHNDIESDNSEKIKIPIQGTNMTLMVSIGTNEQRVKPEVMIGECVGTERNEVTEQGTSVIEECSKGNQYEVDHRLGTYEQKSTNSGLQPKSKKLNVCSVTNEPTYGTYPKSSPVNERKPFRRANTEGSCSKPLLANERKKSPERKSPERKSPDNPCKVPVKSCTCGCDKPNCSEDQCGSHSVVRKPSHEKETQCSVPNTCSCGCGGHIENCSMTCDERKSVIYHSHTQTDGYQCSCGCPGVKECGVNCPEHKNKICGDRKDSADRIPSPKCSCGCGGSVKDCDKGCKEGKANVSSKYSPKHPRSESSRSCDGSGIQKNCSKERKSSASSKCSCGCSGDKEKCSRTCPGLKDSVSSESETQRDKERKGSRSSNCSCGCSGNKEKCSKSCSGLKANAASGSRAQGGNDRKGCGSTKCTCGCSGDKEKCSKNCPELNKNFTSISPNTRKFGSSAKISSKNSGDDANDPLTDSYKSTDRESDPILDMIQAITNKYTKKELEKNKRKKCYKEIMEVLNYLLQTDDENTCAQVTSESSSDARKTERKPFPPKKVDKPPQKSHPCATSSDDIQTTDVPCTSTDTGACKVLNRIKKECERYHQKRCKPSGKKCEVSSSTSANCEQCRRVHYCSCRKQKCTNSLCKCGKPTCKCPKKKPVAYNLILQSESMTEETSCVEKSRPLKNIVVKVPKNKCQGVSSPRETKTCRSRSLPNDSELSSIEELLKRSQACCTVREYLEQNRPDFIAKSADRQNCLRVCNDSRDEKSCAPSQLKMIVVHAPTCSGTCNMYQYQRGCSPVTCMTSNSNYRSASPCGQSVEPCAQTCVNTEVTRLATMRAAQRDLLSMCMAEVSDVNDMNSEELRRVAKNLGKHLRQKPPAPKFISEREMKKHSERIYKSLPEVTRKKEEARKENIKKTNLLMANIFKNNLQKKTLRGLVDISNYSPIVKI